MQVWSTLSYSLLLITFVSQIFSKIGPNLQSLAKFQCSVAK